MTWLYWLIIPGILLTLALIGAVMLGGGLGADDGED